MNVVQAADCCKARWSSDLFINSRYDSLWWGTRTTIGPSRHARWRTDLTLIDPAFDRSSFAQRYRWSLRKHVPRPCTREQSPWRRKLSVASDREEDFFVNSLRTFIWFFFLFFLELTKVFVSNNSSNHERLRWIKQILSSFYGVQREQLLRVSSDFNNLVSSQHAVSYYFRSPRSLRSGNCGRARPCDDGGWMVRATRIRGPRDERRSTNSTRCTTTSVKKLSLFPPGKSFFIYTGGRLSRG